jgi:flagellar protein FliO/FliZ
MDSYIFWTIMLGALALLSAGLAVYLRAYLGGTSPAALFFRPRAERRLEVVDHASLDGRRRLVLIRRDDVEHLLLTGGPVDLVVETGINAGTGAHSGAEKAEKNASRSAAQSTRQMPHLGRSHEPELRPETPPGL